MKTITIRCDHCGKVIGVNADNKYFGYVGMHIDFDHSQHYEFDLCYDCCDEVENFISNFKRLKDENDE